MDFKQKSVCFVYIYYHIFISIFQNFLLFPCLIGASFTETKNKQKQKEFLQKYLRGTY